MIELNKIYNEDCLIGLKKIPDNFVDLVITSPPYDSLRDYNGYSFDFEEIAKQLFRTIKVGGVVVWVVGDMVKKSSKTLTSFKQAIYFQSIGFNVFDIIIYEKSGSSPPHKNRYFNTFEYMFIFSKDKPKYINLIKDKVNKWAGSSTFGNVSVREKNGTLTKKGKKIVNELSYRTNIWKYVSGYGFSSSNKIAYQNPAIFPEKLVKDHLISWSKENDLVLDPFMGSGTTAVVCVQNNRNYIGFEISKDYCDLANKRIKDLPIHLF